MLVLKPKYPTKTFYLSFMTYIYLPTRHFQLNFLLEFQIQPVQNWLHDFFSLWWSFSSVLWLRMKSLIHSVAQTRNLDDFFFLLLLYTMKYVSVRSVFHKSNKSISLHPNFYHLRLGRHHPCPRFFFSFNLFLRGQRE